LPYTGSDRWSAGAFCAGRHLRGRSGRRGRLGRWRRRRCGWCSALGRGELRFKRRQAIAVLLLQRFEIAAELIDLLPQRLRILGRCRRRCRQHPDRND
jgi:hypothetical protein